MLLPGFFRIALAVFLLAVAFVPSGSALILYGVDNSDSTSDPGSGTPWASVGKLTNSTGSIGEGGAIYLGNGYVLTAHHVATGSITHVQFAPEGGLFEIDNAYGFQQVAPGVDLKILKLVNTNPGVQAVNLWTSPTNYGGTSMVIGWGVGRDPSDPVETASVDWGNASTQDKRWGLAMISGAQNGFTGVAGYTNDVLFSQADLPSNPGSPTAVELHEASITIHDSGGGLFQNISGTWYLVGVIEATGSHGTTTFGPGGDTEVYVRINSNASAIQTMTTVPEPGTVFLVATGLLTITVMRRRKRRPHM